MEDNHIYDLFDKIRTKSDFEIFLKELIKNYNENRKDWDNDDLPKFLDALYGYNYESDSSIQPTWKLFAEMLLAARVYE